MIFAQTDLTSTSPAIDPQANSLLSVNAWWLLGLVFAAMVVIGLLSRRRRIRLAEPTKSSLKTRPLIRDSIETDESEFERHRQTKKKSKGKKNKSSKNRSLHSSKELVASNEVQSKDDARTKDEVLKPELKPEPERKAEPVSVAIVTVIPIFEPLRQVGSLRRVSIPEPEKTGRFAIESEQIETNRPSNVPFEKIKKSTDQVRSSTNRWADFVSDVPVRADSARKTSFQVAQTTETDSKLTATPALVVPPSEPVARPAQGLKGFVSKLKNSNAIDSDS